MRNRIMTLWVRPSIKDFAQCVARTLTGACSTFSDALCILHLSRIQSLNVSSGGIGRPCGLTIRCSEPSRRGPVVVVAARGPVAELGSFDLLSHQLMLFAECFR